MLVEPFFSALLEELGIDTSQWARPAVMFGQLLASQLWFQLLTAATIGATIGAWGHWLATRYDRGKNEPPEGTLSRDKIAVYKKKFSFEVVDIDGKSFHDCSFHAVTFRYNGIGPYGFIDCKFSPPINFSVPDERIAGVLGMVQLAQHLRLPFIFGDDEPSTNEPDQR